MRLRVAGTEICHTVCEVEYAMNTSKGYDTQDLCHHDQSAAVQTTFQPDVQKVIDLFEAWDSH